MTEARTSIRCDECGLADDGGLCSSVSGCWNCEKNAEISRLRTALEIAEDWEKRFKLQQKDWLDGCEAIHELRRQLSQKEEALKIAYSGSQVDDAMLSKAPKNRAAEAELSTLKHQLSLIKRLKKETVALSAALSQCREALEECKLHAVNMGYRWTKPEMLKDLEYIEKTAEKALSSPPPASAVPGSIRESLIRHGKDPAKYEHKDGQSEIDRITGKRMCEEDNAPEPKKEDRP